jgi:hypothetical protein
VSKAEENRSLVGTQCHPFYSTWRKERNMSSLRLEIALDFHGGGCFCRCTCGSGGLGSWGKGGCYASPRTLSCMRGPGSWALRASSTGTPNRTLFLILQQIVKKTPPTDTPSQSFDFHVLGGRFDRICGGYGGRRGKKFGFWQKASSSNSHGWTDRHRWSCPCHAT